MMNRIYSIAFSGGVDSFVATHMLLTKAKQNKQEKSIFVLVNFDLASEQMPVQKEASKLLLDYLKEQFKDTENIELLYVPVKIDITNPDIKDIKAGTNDLPFYMGSRNAVFATLLMGIGESFANKKQLQKTEVEIHPVLGIHRHVTYRQYWDTTPAFASVIKQLASLNTEYYVKPIFPLLTMTKTEILRYVWYQKLPYKLTWTCYNPVITEETETYTEYRPCNECQACIERYEAAKQFLPDINDYTIRIRKNVSTIQNMSLQSQEIDTTKLDVERTEQDKKQKRTRRRKRKDKTT